MIHNSLDPKMKYSTAWTGFLTQGLCWAWIVVPYDPSSPLERIVRDIQQAIKVKLYYPALLVALTIPDICMGLTLNKSDFVKKNHYIEFINRYTTEQSLGLDGTSCYQLRGGLVHRADLRGHAYFDNTHVIFTVPESRGHIHALTLVVEDKRAAMFDLELFCQAMIGAARKWYEDHKNDPMVVENLKNLIRWCPEGLPPFVGGLPVVASGA
ncbi:hypothetical protein [Stappia sp. 28M-7]|uniref:hypothetical protein n=1 Tax=Stappia sp. 28M-7 TaxID=2762596 RepID=UPI00163CFB9D|nr:hypothetical protein [Stappia sp. 28M-7]MBC2858837.1 hypothetical protein [Stappia sp. 28M-7]